MAETDNHIIFISKVTHFPAMLWAILDQIASLNFASHHPLIPLQIIIQCSPHSPGAIESHAGAHEDEVVLFIEFGDLVDVDEGTVVNAEKAGVIFQSLLVKTQRPAAMDFFSGGEVNPGEIPVRADVGNLIY